MLRRMLNSINSQSTKIIQYLFDIGGGGGASACTPVPTPMIDV